MRDGIKRTIFRNYWWLGLILGVGFVAALWRVTEDHSTLFASVLAAVLSVAFFVQQQKLAEMQLFKQLIVEFNQRYDRLNDALQRIAQSGIQNDADRLAVQEYFNLCAEEFLFYEEGYVDERVWRAWTNGMRFYFTSPAIASEWQRESTSDSYYGFRPPGAAA